MADESKITRVLYASDLVSEGIPYRQVVREIVKRFSVHERTAEKDIAEVYRQWAADQDLDLPIRREKLRRRLWRIANGAESAGEYTAAVSALRQLSKIDGLDAPAEVKVSGSLDARNLEPRERRARIMELMEKAKKGDDDE